jgi:hypothetical protein
MGAAVADKLVPLRILPFRREAVFGGAMAALLIATHL